MGTELVLTDDEVVAVAADEGDVWPVDLPTVDTGHGGDLQAAVWRGRRALAVRGLLTPAGHTAGLLDGVRRDVVGARSLLGLHVGGAVGSRATSTFVVNAYPSGADWLLETVSDHGVHGFRQIAHDAVVAHLTDLAVRAHTRGVTDGPGLARLWIGVLAEGRRPALQVGEGRASVVDVEGGRVSARTARAVADLGAEVERLALEVRTLAGRGRVPAATE